jgi:mannose-6-phosphate isomerase-like protein (cupin superfamily)
LVLIVTENYAPHTYSKDTEFAVVDGEAVVTIGEDTTIFRPGWNFIVPLNTQCSISSKNGVATLKKLDDFLGDPPIIVEENAHRISQC